jgi:hypothetical protein
MTARLFRLTQMHQRIDDRLRLNANGRNPIEFTRLVRMRHRVKGLIRRLLLQPALA